LGWTFVVGLVVLLLLLPYNFFVSRFMRAFNVEQMRCKDERLKLTNELLMGIRVVKLYAWERPMVDKIAAIRQREACVYEIGFHAKILNHLVHLADL
jgi:ABC-type bacteriocin/lantibiotic exporter with double-glycine peptidase domain